MPNLASEIIRPETSGKVFEISRCYDVFLLFGWDQILSFGWEIPNIVSWLPSFGHLKISEDPYTPLPINRSRTSGSPNSILSGAGGDPRAWVGSKRWVSLCETCECMMWDYMENILKNDGSTKPHQNRQYGSAYSWCSAIPCHHAMGIQRYWVYKALQMLLMDWWPSTYMSIQSMLWPDSRMNSEVHNDTAPDSGGGVTMAHTA